MPPWRWSPWSPRSRYRSSSSSRATATPVLDAGSVEQGVAAVVTSQWRRPTTDVRCPDDRPVRAGTSFTCTATVDGGPQQVPVTVLDDTGTYAVGQPRP